MVRELKEQIRILEAKIASFGDKVSLISAAAASEKEEVVQEVGLYRHGRWLKNIPAEWAEAVGLLSLGDYTTGEPIDKMFNDRDLEFLAHYIHGPIWDGNVPSKASRDRLFDLGFIERCRGFQFLNARGVSVLVDHKLINEHSWRDP